MYDWDGAYCCKWVKHYRKKTKRILGGDLVKMKPLNMFALQYSYLFIDSTVGAIVIPVISDPSITELVVGF